jgi:hypothetical protein
MAKYRRQPKAGDLAYKPAAPFKARGEAYDALPSRVALSDALYKRPASEREPTVYPAHIVIKRLAAGTARDAETWRKRGGMSGGKTGCCAGVTGSNGIGIVPAAFMPR